VIARFCAAAATTGALVGGCGVAASTAPADASTAGDGDTDASPSSEVGGPDSEGGAYDVAAESLEDGDAWDAAEAEASGRTCVEGMECQQTDVMSHATDFDCLCRSGTWSCSVWTLATAPGTGLPAEDPDPSQRCWGVLPGGGANVACSLPDRCGSFCFCGQNLGNNWQCSTVAGPGDAATIGMGVPDATASAYPDAGCDWPPCSLVGADSGSCTPGEPRCVVVSCSAGLCGPSGPSGSLANTCSFSN
jgi:hypothetical protein